MFTIEKLWQAYKDCISTKRNTVSALKFEMDRERNLFTLLDELQNRTYKISQHICFIINDPTPREIFAANFRDRIVHHLLCNEITRLFEPEFIENSFANRKGKGTHKAVNALRSELRKGGYFLKLDIQAFFRSINKEILYRILERKVQGEALWLCKTIIYHDPVKDHVFCGQYPKSIIPPSKSLFYSNGTGLPIGNLTSQFFGNVYLNELDQYIRSLGFRHIRYVDDFVLFSERKEDLVSVISKIDTFLLDSLNLSIHPKKVILQEVSKGVDFLGYLVKPTHTLVRRKVVARLRKKMWKKDCGIAVLNSYFGHFLHASSYGLRKAICEKMNLSYSSDFRKFIPSPSTDAK